MKGKSMFKKILKLAAHVLVAKAAVQAFDHLVEFVTEEWRKGRDKTPPVKDHE